MRAGTFVSSNIEGRGNSGKEKSRMMWKSYSSSSDEKKKSSTKASPTIISIISRRVQCKDAKMHDV